MIYTVTFNPALDYIVTLDELKTGCVNRTGTEQILPGGKGINVSIVLKNLGFENTALGFVAGFTGREIEKRLKELGCKAEFIRIEEGLSRINVKIKADRETEINGAGPQISRDNLELLFRRFESMAEGDILVLAGSIPATLPDSIYSDIMKKIEGKGIKCVVDATGDLLLNVLKYRPFLVKPNKHELAEMYHVSIETEDDIVMYAKKLKEGGAVNVLVSMAGDGAILIDGNGQVHKSPSPEGTVVNSVGAGDSMVAGFIAGYMEKEDYDHAFMMGISAGSASAFSNNLATKDEVMEIYRRISL